LANACCKGQHYLNATITLSGTGPARNHRSRHSPPSRWLLGHHRAYGGLRQGKSRAACAANSDPGRGVSKSGSIREYGF